MCMCATSGGMQSSSGDMSDAFSLIGRERTFPIPRGHMASGVPRHREDVVREGEKERQIHKGEDKDRETGRGQETEGVQRDKE